MNKEKVDKLLEGKGVRVYLYKDGRYREELFANTTRNIANFLGQHQYDTDRIVLTDMFDNLILDFRGGFVDCCPDQKYLQGKLLPMLMPIQMGYKEPRKVEVTTWEEVETYRSMKKVDGGMEITGL